MRKPTAKTNQKIPKQSITIGMITQSLAINPT